MEHDTKEFKRHIIFPLCALSINLELKKLIKYLIDYAIVQLAIKELKETEFKEERIKSLTQQMARYKATVFYEDNTPYYPEIEQFEDDFEDCKKKYLNYYIIVVAKERKINIKKKSIKRVIQNYQVVNYHKEKYEKKNKADARVLLNLPLLYDVRDKEALTENEFRVLCAIYSCLGQKQYFVITYKMIRYRAMGYKIENSECNKETLMSNKVLSRIIKKLLQRNFFIRHYNGRVFYYSKYLTPDELKNIMENKLKLEIINRNTFNIQKSNLGNFKKTYSEKLKNLSSNELNEERKKILKEIRKKKLP
jgi:predicted transcriptional regulator